MGKFFHGIVDSVKKRTRLWVQVFFTALTNGYFIGFVQGKIYTGPGKALCLPGLNCYSCPGALGSCPIGALQSVLGDRKFSMSFYVAGFFLLVGSLVGRFVCGWLCPFGLVQDLLYKIPFLRKVKNLPGHKVLIWLKYIILVVFVILLPMFIADFSGRGTPWFCKYICPAGTLEAGLPLAIANTALRGALGFLFQWKAAILIVIVLLSLMVYRPFCKYLCPLGAVYSLFNRVSVTGIKVDKDLCVACGKCRQVCKMDVEIWKHPGSLECIQCGDCVKACPTGALRKGLTKGAGTRAGKNQSKK